MVRCYTRIRRREEDSTEAIEVDSDEVDINSQPENTTLIIGRRPVTHKGSLIEGEAILLDQVTKLPDRMRVLWKTRPLRRGVPKEETRVGFD